MSIEIIFNIAVVIFTVANLAAMGLETDVRAALKTFRDFRFPVLTLGWGWIVGPVIAYLITLILPLSDAHAAGLMLISLAPTAPFFPLMVSKARGDMAFAASFMLLATVGTVVLLPLMAPLLIKGVTVSVAALAKPLLLMVLLPLVIGAAVKVYAAPLAAKLFPVVKKIGVIFLLIVLVLTLVLYGKDMLGAIGSFAPGAQVLFFIIITVLSYKVGFGLKQNQRSGMALGMCTRNIAAVFAAFFGIPDPPPGLFVMIVLVVPLAAIVALLAARIFARHAVETMEGEAT